MAPPRRSVVTALALLLGMLLAAEVARQYRPNTWIFRDGRFYINVNEGLLAGAGLEDTYARSWYDGRLPWTRNLPRDFRNVALGQRGELYHFRPYLLPLLATPFYWAFGLQGALLFNLLCLLAIGLSVYRVLHEYTKPVPAAAIAVLFLFGTGVRLQMYNFSVDILLLAFFCGAWAELSRGPPSQRAPGLAAGVLFGLTVVIKPTSLLYALPLALLSWQRNRGARLVPAVAGTLVVGFLAGAINHYMYGAPWWLGYNRVLSVVGGDPAVASHVDEFAFPFAEGLERMWSGRYGLRRHWAIFLLAVPGILRLWSRPLYAVAALASAASAVLVFARFDYEGDRFLFPALALLLPAVAAGLDAVAAGVRRVARLRHASSGAVHVSVLLVLASAAQWLQRGGPPISMMDSSYVTAVRLLAEQNILSAAPSSWLAEAAGVPFWWVAGSWGLVVQQLAGVALLGYCASRFLASFVPAPVVAATLVGLFLLPPLAQVGVRGGAPLGAAVLAVAAAWRVYRSHWKSGTALFGAAAWCAVESWPGVPGVDVLSAAMRPGGTTSIWFGFALLAPLGVWVAARRRFSAGALLGLGLSLVPWIGLDATNRATPWAALAVGLPAAPLGFAVAQALIHVRLRFPRLRVQPRAAVVATLVALGLGGWWHRSVQAASPFRVERAADLKRAVVHLDDVPCDFMAWENMSWECATLDGGPRGRTGLALPDGIQVAGRPAAMLLIPTDRRGHRSRRVTWYDVAATDRLRLRWQVPDGFAPNARVEVQVADQTVDAFVVENRPLSPAVRVVDTTPWAGRRVRLQFRVRSTRPGQLGAIAVAGGFVAAR